MLSRLKIPAYFQLRVLCNDYQPDLVPTQGFIDELFNSEYPQELLQKYVVAHVAFWIRCSRQGTFWREWAKVMEKTTTFSAAVAIKLVQNLGLDNTTSFYHPSQDPEFSIERHFPTAEQVKKQQDEARKAKAIADLSLLRLMRPDHSDEAILFAFIATDGVVNDALERLTSTGG